MAQLDVNERSVSGVTIADLVGKITIADGSVQLRNAVRDLLERGDRKILLNFGEVSYIDSSGIGELVAAYTTTGKQGGKLKLFNLSKDIRDVLTATKLITVFQTFDNEKDAVSSFN